MQESEESGCAILPGAAAYLEAEVVSRLEAGDHWIVYAKVNSGKVRPCPDGILLSLFDPCFWHHFLASNQGNAGPTTARISIAVAHPPDQLANTSLRSNVRDTHPPPAVLTLRLL